MKPWILPASTTLSTVAGAITIILVWLLKITAAIEVPDYVAQSFTLIITVLVGHFTVDTPPTTVVQAVVDKAVASVKKEKE